MRSIVLKLVEDHLQFVSQHNVAAEWFVLSEISGPPGSLTQNDFAVVDTEYISRQVPLLPKDDFWFPRSEDERAQLTMFMEGTGSAFSAIEARVAG